MERNCGGGSSDCGGAGGEGSVVSYFENFTKNNTKYFRLSSLRFKFLKYPHLKKKIISNGKLIS